MINVIRDPEGLEVAGIERRSQVLCNTNAEIPERQGRVVEGLIACLSIIK